MSRKVQVVFQDDPRLSDPHWQDWVRKAAAEAAGLTLLHYDHDYDLIAEITRQPTAWVVDRGSV